MTENNWTQDDQQKLAALQSLAESILKESGKNCGPVGLVNLTRIISRSPRNAELAPFVPWITTRALAGHPYDLDDAVSYIINTPVLHNSLFPHFPEIMTSFLAHEADEKKKTAHCFLGPALELGRSGNKELFESVKHLFPEALMRTTWSSHNFGILGIAWLDLGGDAATLIAPLQKIFDDCQDDPASSLFKKDRETKLVESLCCSGFIKLMNHPRISESAELKSMLAPYAGITLKRDHVPGAAKNLFPWRDDVDVMTMIKGDRTAVVWHENGNGYATYVPIERVAALRNLYAKAVSPEQVIDAATELFRTMAAKKECPQVQAAGALKEIEKLALTPV